MIDLMTPRYKVIADYPKSLYKVGDILNAGWRSEDCIYCDTEGPRWRHYPHLFRPLEWWEHREQDVMPRFLRDTFDGEIFKAECTTTGMCYVKPNKKEQGDLRYTSLKNFTPATEEQFNALK